MSMMATQRGQAIVPGYMYDALADSIAAKDAEIARLRKVVEGVAGFYALANYKEFIEDGGRKALAALAELEVKNG